MVKQNQAKRKGRLNTKNMLNRAKKSQSFSRSRSSMSNINNPTFGAVSTINTAPVALGNSLRGSKAQVVSRSSDGIRVIGRDFAFQAAATGSISTWVNVGGFPLTPACFVSSTLRAYTQIYNKFKFHKINAHYITSSATSSTGDILFSVGKNRDDPPPNGTSSTFLNYALSDPNTVIGPQWTNHTVSFSPTGPWRTLDLGINSDINAQAQGEIFLWSKTTTVDSPGYVIFDYDISFAEMSVNPRSGLLPNPNILYNPATLNLSAIVGDRVEGGFSATWAGATTITRLDLTPTFATGDVYKFICDATNSIFVTSTATNMLQCNIANNSVSALTPAITDGLVLYLVAVSATRVAVLPTITQAFASDIAANTMTFRTATGAGTQLYGLASFIGTINPTQLKQQ